ncbi:hypothetical protein OEZ60_14635 [Defluviimonas sp. WL0024]|uniref:Uncharacterized protein n=1 Tax=Albidovulum salinarum TaxID=2984153 RepID=A0ABT2X5M1_9RHOB|nr:hypothetical protein [Defluviimonas sp. WL0024]MCU9849238.1 hypothetical protein [Defluviimonas sp. WL0024]
MAQQIEAATDIKHFTKHDRPVIGQNSGRPLEGREFAPLKVELYEVHRAVNFIVEPHEFDRAVFRIRRQPDAARIPALRFNQAPAPRHFGETTSPNVDVPHSGKCSIPFQH